MVLDISSGSVGAGLVSLKLNSSPIIISSSRTSLNLQNKPTTETIEKALLESLHKSLVEVGQSSVEKVIISFSSPWITSGLRTYSYKSKIPFIVDQKYISNILNEQESEFAKELNLKYTNKSEVFNSKITSISLNGYDANPKLGKKVSSIEIQMMMNASEKSLIQKIEEEIIKVIGVRDGVLLENFMFAFMTVLTNAFQNVHSALLINMSNETSDFLLVRNGHPLFSISLPVCPAYIARAIQKEFDVPLNVAYSYISLFSEGVLEKEMIERMDKLFGAMEIYWTNEWQKAISSIEGEQTTPNKIFIIGSVPNESVIKTLLSSIFSGHEVVMVDRKSNLMQHLTTASTETGVDDRVSILAAFSKICS